jgi:transcriptional regulator with XRE-family HTH domain
MSIVHDETARNGPSGPAKKAGSASATRKLHRVASVRQEQGVSIRTAARQLGHTLAAVRSQESEETDLRISELMRWQQILNVPLADLLVDPGSALSRPVMERARLIRLMKTAAAIRESVKSAGASRLATMLVEQLLEIMPELAEVSAWHSVGQRRSLDEYGRIVERRMRDEWFFHRGDF